MGRSRNYLGYLVLGYWGTGLVRNYLGFMVLRYWGNRFGQKLSWLHGALVLGTEVQSAGRSV